MLCRIPRRAAAVGLFLASVLGSLSSASAGPQYSLTDLGEGSFTAINNAGQVAFSRGNQSYLYSGYGPNAGTEVSLGTIDGKPMTGDFNWPTAVNDAGQVVGGAPSPSSGGVHHAFLYQNGTMSDLGALPGGGISFATGINASGAVAGYSYQGAGGATGAHAFVYQNGTMTDLGTFGHAESYAYGINALGQVAGFTQDGNVGHAFLYSNGTKTDLGTLGGASSWALGINNAGQVIGGSAMAGGANHAFLYSRGMMKDLGTLGGASSSASGINNAGQVVGMSDTAGGEGHAFLYSGGKMIDLNSLLPPNSGWSNLGLGVVGPQINDAGQIVVSGLHDGKSATLLLTPADLPEPTPVPEPSVLGFAGLVLALGVVRSLRRRQDKGPQSVVCMPT